MSQINIHNYEAYLLDFSEGNLTDELQMELELFLIQHPELDINLSELALVSIEEETISFSNKANLKKSESDLISEEQFIAYIEHQLPADEKIGLEKSCAVNPSLANELALYQKTITSADTTIVFQNKNKLKRNPKVIWFNLSLTQYAAAACVLFLIGLFILWPKVDTVNNSGLATNSGNNHQNTIIKNGSPTVAPNKQYLNTVTIKETTIPSQKSNSTVAKSKNINTSLTNNIVSNNQNTIPKKDSTTKTIELQNPTNASQNDILLATNTAPTSKKQNNTIVQVITENDDEPIASNNDKKKKGIWVAASRALKNLNHAGVKTVNGDEETSTDNAAYALTIGGVSITHKSGL
jgi:hypothetical protein